MRLTEFFNSLLQVSQWYELVVFTASMEIYGTAVADKLDGNKGILRRRYYRQHCTLDFGSHAGSTECAVWQLTQLALTTSPA